MATLREFCRRLRGALRPRPSDDDLERELRFHIEQAEAELRRQGFSKEEALRRARIRFGGVSPTLDTLRDQRGLPWLDDLRTDLRHAARALSQRRGFAAAAVLILALGIGAATAVFSVSETLLLRPLPYPEGDRLVALRSVSPTQNLPSSRTGAGTLADWQREPRSFEAIAGYRWITADVIDGGRSERLNGLWVTPEFFDALGVSVLGRTFRIEDRGSRTIVLGHDRLRDADVEAPDNTLVGGTLDLNVRDLSRIGPTRYLVLGVASAPVRFPPLEVGFELGVPTVIDTVDFWMSRYVVPTDSRTERYWDVVAKLRPGATLAQAQTEMDGIARRQEADYPDSSQGWGIDVVPLRNHIAGEARRGILLLSVGTGMLLLIACANVATLLLARGMARRREVAIRSALGAGRWRLVRQFLVEATALAACAGLLGIVFAGWAVEVARPWLPRSLPALQEMGINPTVLVFALVGALGTAVVTGIAPALRSARADGVRLTGRDGRGMTAGGQTRLVGLLVSAEVAMTVLLLLGAGLLVRSAWLATQVAPGFHPANLLTMTIALPENKFDWDHNAIFANTVVDEVRALPTISAAAVIQGVPMRGGSFYGGWTPEGYVPAEGEQIIYRLRVVSPDYFDTMQIPVLAGRTFEPHDEVGERGHNRTALVSESFAERYWPGQDPLGRRIGSPEQFMTVVGVVGDVRYSGLETDPTVDVYLPHGLFPQAAITLIARTVGDPLDAVAAVRGRIRSVDQHAFVTNIRSMNQLIAGSQAERRAGTLLVTAFGAFALVLVVAGIYSVIAQAVVQRQIEFAIRAALGAGPRQVVTLAMRTALQPAALGIALGLAAAIGATRVVASLLFGIGTLDVVAWVGAGGLPLAACLAAGYLPARRAARIDPMTALRTE